MSLVSAATCRLYAHNDFLGSILDSAKHFTLVNVGNQTDVKGVGRRRTQLLDDLRNRRCWKLKEEAKKSK